MYFIEGMRPPGTLNVARAWKINRPVRPEWLSAAGKALVERYDSLNLRFTFDRGTLWAVQPPFADVHVNTEQWPVGDGKPLDQWLKEAAAYPFMVDMDSSLFRVNVLWAPEQVVVCLVAHHLVADWWSMNLLFASFMSYVDRLSGKGENTAEPVKAPSFLDYAASMAERQHLDEEAAARHYWQEIFSSRQPLRFRPPPGEVVKEPDVVWTKKRETRWATADFGRGEWDALRARSAAERCTPFALMLTVLFEVMAPRTETTEFVICIPTFNRGTGSEMHLVGCLANRIYLMGPPEREEFSSRLRHTASHLKRALRFQEFPFDDLVNEWGTRDLQVIYDAMLRVYFGIGSHIAVAQYINSRVIGSSERHRDVIPLQVEVGGGMTGDFYFLMRGTGDSVSVSMAVNPGVLPGRQVEDMMLELTQRVGEITGSEITGAGG